MKKYLIVLLLITACQPAAHHQEDFETLEVFKMPKTDLVFESVRFVPLSSGDDHLVGNQLLTKLYDGEIFILDLGSQKSVVRFDESGKFLNKIGRAGRGVEEFVGARDFANHGDTVSVLATFGEESKVISYLKDGTFVKSISIDLAANSYEKIPSGFIFNTGTNPAFHSHRFYSTDQNGNIQNSYLKNDTKLDLVMREENFSIHQSDVYIHEAFSNALYVYRSGNIEQTYLLDLSEYNLPQEFYTKSLMEGFPLIQKQGFGNISNYFENNRYSIFEVLIQKAGSDSKVFQFAYDKKRKDLFQHSYIGYEENNEVFQHLISLSEKNELVYLIFPVEVIDNIEALKGYETGKGTVFEDMNEMDNPILAFCKLK